MFEEMDWCKDDKRYTAFSSEKIDKDIVIRLNKMCVEYKNKIVELEDYIEKHRLYEYDVFKKNNDIHFTVKCSLNGSSDTAPYTLTKGSYSYDS